MKFLIWRNTSKIVFLRCWKIFAYTIFFWLEWFYWLGLDVVIPMKDKLNLKLFLVWDYHYFYDHIKLHFYRCLTLIKWAIEMRNIAIIVDELQFQVKHHDCTQNYNHLDKLKYFCLFSRGRKSNYFFSILINHYNIKYNIWLFKKYKSM